MFERYRARAAQGWPIAVLLRVLVVLCWVMLLTVSCLAAGSLYLQSENFHQLTQVDDPAVDANNEVRQAMADAETGLTGYRISGDRTLLQPYFGSHERTLTALATLQGKFALGARTETDIARYNALGVRQRLAVEQWWAYALRTEQILSSGGRADVFQGRALWARFSSENATLGVHLLTARSQTQIEAQTISKVVYVSIAAAVASLLAMLLLGGWAARGISRPLTELRDTMIRQREGEPDARAREDQGSEELRFVARDFNELTKQNLALRDTQMRALATHQVTFEIARAISKASDTREALDIERLQTPGKHWTSPAPSWVRGLASTGSLPTPLTPATRCCSEASGTARTCPHRGISCCRRNWDRSRRNCGSSQGSGLRMTSSTRTWRPSR